MKGFSKHIAILCLLSADAYAKMPFPNVCTVVNTPTFPGLLELSIAPTICPGIPPRPCAHFSYYVPKYFIEVVANPAESFFSAIPGVGVQIGTLIDRIPYGVEANSGSYSSHAHVLNVPLSEWAFEEFPCGGASQDYYCLSAMSEHLGIHWKSGSPDMWQPTFQAWAISPKACILKGAAESLAGSGSSGRGGGNIPCSRRMDWLVKYPPTSQPICTGWGIHFPRGGTVTSSDQTTASLVIASRIKSLGAEVFHSVSISPDEKWQMIYPNPSAGFREGQNIAAVWGLGANELGRLRGTFKNYLYVIWQRVSCTKDIPYVAFTKAWLAALQAICKGA